MNEHKLQKAYDAELLIETDRHYKELKRLEEKHNAIIKKNLLEVTTSELQNYLIERCDELGENVKVVCFTTSAIHGNALKTVSKPMRATASSLLTGVAKDMSRFLMIDGVLRNGTDRFLVWSDSDVAEWVHINRAEENELLYKPADLEAASIDTLLHRIIDLVTWEMRPETRPEQLWFEGCQAATRQAMKEVKRKIEAANHVVTLGDFQEMCDKLDKDINAKITEYARG